jgi:hypothetical protein
MASQEAQRLASQPVTSDRLQRYAGYDLGRGGGEGFLVDNDTLYLCGDNMTLLDNGTGSGSVGCVTLAYDNVTGLHNATNVYTPKYGLYQMIMISIVVVLLATFTAGGNMMVIIAFRMDKTLQTVSEEIDH